MRRRQELVELIYATVREKQTYFHLPESIALLAAKPREFLLRRVRCAFESCLVPYLYMVSESRVIGPSLPKCWPADVHTDDCMIVCTSCLNVSSSS